MANLKAVLEFGTSKIICMIDTAGIREMDIPAASCIRYEGIKGNSWVNSDSLPLAVENAITTAEKKCSKQIKSIYVGVPSCFSKTVLKESKFDIPGGVITSDLLKRMVESIKPKDMFDYDLIDVRPIYFMDSAGNLYVDLPNGIRTKTLFIMVSFFYAKKIFTEYVTSILNDMHISVKRFVNEICQEAITYIPENKRFSTAILLDIGYTQTSVSAVYYDSILATEIIHIGGEDIVKELIGLFGISTQVAESLKRGHVFGLSTTRSLTAYGRDENGKMLSFNQSKVTDIIEEKMYDLSREIVTVINSFYRKKIISKNADIYLTGAGAVMKGADTYLQNIIGKNIIIVKNPMSQVFTPVYNTAFSLLDNNIDRAYDLCGGVYQTQITSRLGKLFK